MHSSNKLELLDDTLNRLALQIEEQERKARAARKKAVRLTKQSAALGRELALLMREYSRRVEGFKTRGDWSSDLDFEAVMEMVGEVIDIKVKVE